MSRSPIIEGDPESTQKIYRIIKEKRSGKQSSFADCDCQDCLRCGEHWSAWITPEFMRFAEGLGIDWQEPVEVCCSGDLGKERTTVMADYLGQGQVSEGRVGTGAIEVHVAKGNRTPGRYWPFGLEKPSEERLYTLHISFSVDRDLR